MQRTASFSEIEFSLRHILLFVFFGLLFGSCTAQSLETTPHNWMDDWEVAPGFSIEPDSQNYKLPTAIVFIPEPGADPKDPAYFVAELRGRIRVVTNDRSVFTFSDGFSSIDPEQPFADLADQFGLVGLCLAPQQGYLFATLAYRDAQDALYNQIVRFESTPVTFSTKPESYRIIAPFLSNYEIGSNHQIGGCQVEQDQLFISVGDGTRTNQSQSLQAPLGKVLRMSLDGKPLPDNPYYQDARVDHPTNFIWAYGFRNPFGLEIAKGRYFVAENGLETDRFLEVQAGQNYLWDGTAWSIGVNAAFVIDPAAAPTHLVYLSADAQLFPQAYQGAFFIGLNGSQTFPDDPLRGGVAGILRVPYDFSNNRIPTIPQYFLRYRGEGVYPIVGLDLGPDGLYFAPLLPDGSGTSRVYKIQYNPEQEHPHVLGEIPTAEYLITSKGCLACHSLGDLGNTNIGPSLDRDVLVRRLEGRLNTDAYLQTLDEVDQIGEIPFTSFTAARAQLRSSEGMERIRIWVTNRLIEPKFDNPAAQMPNLGLTEAEADVLADFLLADPGFYGRIKPIIKELLPNVTWWHLVFAFIGGLTAAWVVGWAFRQFRNKNLKP